MPQLPSGLHVAIVATPLEKLMANVGLGHFVHDLMAIKTVSDIYGYIDILYFRDSTGTELTFSFSPDSVNPPLNLEPYLSGYTLRAWLHDDSIWSAEDRRAFLTFVTHTKTEAFYQALLNEVKKNQKTLLAGKSLAGLQAIWWQAGCHPLQENPE